jgi:hypothetical protein
VSTDRQVSGRLTSSFARWNRRSLQDTHISGIGT